MKTKVYNLDSDSITTPQEARNDSTKSIFGEIAKQFSDFSPLKDIASSMSRLSQNEYVDPVMPDMGFGPITKYPELSESYPKGNKKYRVPKRILSRLIQKTATTFQIAKCIDQKLTIKSFKGKSVFFTKKVKNRIVSLNRTLKLRGYFINTQKGVYELTKI